MNQTPMEEAMRGPQGEADARMPSLAIAALAAAGSSPAAGIGLLALVELRRLREFFSAARPASTAASTVTPPPICLPEDSREFLRSRRAYMRACQLAGEPLDIAIEEAPALLEEVKRHRWIEAEKAGRDIWSEMEPHRPERAAVRDWVAKHYEAWRRWKDQGAMA